MDSNWQDTPRNQASYIKTYIEEKHVQILIFKERVNSKATIQTGNMAPKANYSHSLQIKINAYLVWRNSQQRAQFIKTVEKHNGRCYKTINT